MSSLADKLKHYRFVRALIYFLVGMFTYPGINIFNKLRVQGTDNLKGLPRKNVLFISNHQTYFAEVITFLHIFCAVKWKKKNRLGLPYYLFNPYTNVFFVSAASTMKRSLMTRIFELAGSINIKRAWNEESNDIRKGLDPSDTRKIERILEKSWVINFPQGTTKANAPGRKGTVYLIKKNNPIVIPIVIKGFNKAFDKKGLRLIKFGTEISVTFKKPLIIDKEKNNDEILVDIMQAIEENQN